MTECGYMYVGVYGCVCVCARMCVSVEYTGVYVGVYGCMCIVFVSVRVCVSVGRGVYVGVQGVCAYVFVSVRECV